MTSRSGLQPSWLLLLPNPPKEITFERIKEAYASTISQALLKAADISASFTTVQILDIGLPCIKVYSSSGVHYSYLHNLLRQVYSLICLLCTEHSIDVQHGNDVDVRLVLFQSPSPDNRENSPAQTEDGSSVGPVITLHRLASCHRPWQRVCSVASEDGELLLQIFLRLRNSSLDDKKEKLVVERFVPEIQPASLRDPTPVTPRDTESRACHESVAVGGTFDHLHIGHKLLLSLMAFILRPTVPSAPRQKRTITVGITGDKLLENKQFREYLQNWYQRQAAVQAFLSALLVLDAPSEQTSSDNGEGEGDQQRTMTMSWPSGLTINYVEIFDPFGPTITDESITALVLSEETRAGGKAVNEKRAERGWPALDIFEVNVLDMSDQSAGTSNKETQDFQNKISSTEIRRRLGKRPGTANGKSS
ncbi:MAG: hypothetical protein LQ346_007691 [Caloplaca aetnensis]|nr:MAG: hypothetical protein LQ346_007691 [Caloplaca aetnensis]